MKKVIFIYLLMLFNCFIFITAVSSQEKTDQKDQEAAEQMKAKAELKNAKGETVGTVDVTESDDTVTLEIDLKALPSGKHSFHIHEKGECTPPDFTSAGDHFNPGNKQHGFLNPNGPHAGDLPNIEVKEDGTASVTIKTKLVTLKKDAANSLFKDGGTSFVIHANEDDYITDPAGKGGDRIACGLITPAE
jgi:Cu-Zn family superoxide dismutase